MKMISAYNVMSILQDAVWGWFPMFPLRISDYTEEEAKAFMSGVAMMTKAIIDCAVYDIPLDMLKEYKIKGNKNDQQFKAYAETKFNVFRDYVEDLLTKCPCDSAEAPGTHSDAEDDEITLLRL